MNKKTCLLVSLIMLLTLPLLANNIAVGTVTITDQSTAGEQSNHYTHIEFDISWENSWRLDGVAAPYNWDAAWVFAKWKLHSGTDWAHCTLNTSGHTAPNGSVVENPTSDNPQTGVFIYRSADNKTTEDNAASVDWNYAKLRWNYGDDVADDAKVDVKVFAIEMVYVPGGNFYVGSGGSETSAFYQYPTSTEEYQITSEAEITVGTTNGNLYYPSSSYGGDQSGPIPAAFPKGYAAFYCMKYEISQRQYVDFLNTLDDTQDNNRAYTSGIYRHGISGSYGNYSTTNPYVACNYLSWADGAAYADWAGLRPMTELEFEKVCRGDQNAVANEYAWGSTSITAASGITNSGAANEVASNSESNACYGNSGTDGPLRVGAFAKSNTSRSEAGASYYGIMELSGNLWERPVTLGNSAGRAFTGINGNGAIDASGNADVTNWPGTAASGSGFRGGNWSYVAAYLRVSSRSHAASTVAYRHDNYGFRSARTQ